MEGDRQLQAARIPGARGALLLHPNVCSRPSMVRDEAGPARNPMHKCTASEQPEKRRSWVLAGAAVVVVLTVAGGVVVDSRASHATPAAQGPTVSTAKVQRRDLSAMASLNGVLTYRAQSDGSPYSVTNQTQGTYTQLPELGQVLSQGQVLYRVNDKPVVLLDGTTPVYRTLSFGMTGADVTELNADLVALGYGTPAQLSSTSASFGSATTAALERLQASQGMTQDGTLSLGQVVFEPTGVRVTRLPVPLGSSAQAGQSVMEATSTTHQVEVALNASQQSEVSVGDKVTITLPSNKTTPGVVASVGTVATCPSASASGGSSASSTVSGTDFCSSGGSGSSPTPTIDVVVDPSEPAATGTWDQAPVQVTITTASVPGALVVPVTSLLARSGGGYAVEVAGSGGSNHLVAVSLGLFDDADGLVQVTGSGLATGEDVVVPST